LTEKSFLEEQYKNIEYNLKTINEKIASAAEKSGRKREDIRFMTVTKTVDVFRINKAIECGVDLIGENKVQEFLSKKPDLNLENVESHLIGHLQTNKVSKIVGQVDMIESVDSIKLANEISKQSLKLGVSTDILVELNIGGEENKTGLPFEMLNDFLFEVSELPAVNVKGLMTIPPFSQNNEENRKYFSKIYNMYVDIRSKKIHNINMDILSMGMSGDYEQAILSGSNLVRIGSAIFGPRIY
jgi:pyridoxal phosphate enzyme (YggS family)